MARNSGGLYTLPSSVNPVVTGTTITSTWANTTLDDLANELTNSVDRGGRGAMTAPLQCVPGTVAAPGVTFAGATNYGLAKSGATLTAVAAGVAVLVSSSTQTDLNCLTYLRAGGDTTTLQAGPSRGGWSTSAVRIGGTTDVGCEIWNNTTSAAFPTLLLTNQCGLVGYVGTFVKFQQPSSTVAGSISSSVAGAIAYNTSSDYRLKENVAPLLDAAALVSQLRPVTFNFKADPNHTEIQGFIAHEVQAVVPYVVTGQKDGEDMQQMDASKLVPLLTAALQDALARIKRLEDLAAATV